MGKFAWFVLGVILGVILTLGAQYYLSKKAPPSEEVPAVAAKPIGPAGPLPVTPAPETAVAPPVVKPRPAAPPEPRYVPRQAAEEVAEDAAAVGMTSKRKPAPAKPAADDSIPY
ncbi:MAG: hypothetical protein ACXW3D_00470 [Caulobacteraceae bacterium]